MKQTVNTALTDIYYSIISQLNGVPDT